MKKTVPCRREEDMQKTVAREKRKGRRQWQERRGYE
jgi:hypothetical protein